MLTRLLQILLLATIALLACRPASGDESASPPRIEEEMWALPFPLPVLAYVVRPLGDGPFPLVVMNHGISLDANQRTMFPTVEYRDAAFWFARRGYFVISPVRYGAYKSRCSGPWALRGCLRACRQLRQPELPRPGARHRHSQRVGHREHAEEKTDRTRQSHCRGPVGRRLGIDCACQSEPAVGSCGHHICGGAWRPGRWQAKQQLCS